MYEFICTNEDIIASKLTNCYECGETTGKSSATTATQGHLNVAQRANLNADFYKQLGFDKTIWNYSTIGTKGCPELK